jgi:glycosyltransferase involved in cell wall biosynthesis
MTDKVAVVVQRCHESITGGSEALAWQYATLLSTSFTVDILTTTALDHVRWANDLPPGIEEKQGIAIHRFPVTIGRSPYWRSLAERMFEDYKPPSEMKRGRGLFSFFRRRPSATGCPWPIAAEEELIRHQGPHSEPLLDFLTAHNGDYRSIFFVTYLFPTTYFGMARIGPARALLVPTLHDEPFARLRVVRRMARRARSIIWLSEAEEALGKRLWGDVPGQVAAMAVDTELSPPARPGFPYVLYCGRIDAAKGCDRLVRYFLRFKKDHASDLRLVLTGEDTLGVPAHPDIDYRGRVTDEEKRGLMAGARLFVMPSCLESFSIATLEAMAQKTPVLVNGGGPVVADHVRRSGAGRCYRDYSSFEAALVDLLGDPARTAALGARGRDYVLARYQRERVRQRLVDQVTGVPLAA